MISVNQTTCGIFKEQITFTILLRLKQMELRIWMCLLRKDNNSEINNHRTFFYNSLRTLSGTLVNLFIHTIISHVDTDLQLWVMFTSTIRMGKNVMLVIWTVAWLLVWDGQVYFLGLSDTTVSRVHHQHVFISSASLYGHNLPIF